MHIVLDIPDVVWRAFMDGEEPSEASRLVTEALEGVLHGAQVKHA